MCVWLLFFSLTSDVSTLKKMSIVEIIRWMSKMLKQEDRLLTECRLISTNKKIDNWLSLKQTHWLTDFQNKKINYWRNVEDSSKEIDTIDCHCSRLTDWLTFRTKRSTIDCHSRKLTMRQVEVRFNHRSQRKNFSLSQVHDHSRWLTMRIVEVRCNHRPQRENFVVCLVMRTSHSDDFLQSRVLLRKSDDFVLLTRVFRRAICFEAEDLIECQLVSQNSEREICCARDSESSSLRIDREISCWRCAIVTNCLDLVSFYSLIACDSSECEVYIARHDEDQI